MFIPKKYLNETVLFNQRITLEESVLLIEAQATAKQLVIDLNKLDTLLPELLKELANSKTTDIAENIKTDCTEILALINEAKNFKKFKDLKELMSYIRKKASSVDNDEQFSDETIKTLQPLCYKIASDGNSVKDRLKDIRSHKGAIGTHITTLQTRVPALKENIKELYKLFEEPEEETKPDPDPKLKAGIDWTAERAKRLANTGGKPASEVLDKFYADYYSIEYAGEAATDSDKKAIVDKLNSLNKLLTQEFNKLGYNPTVNPFAQFLKLLIKYKKDIFDKLTLNNYGAIHNAFIEKYITGNKLGNYNSKNLLFCSDLYNYKGLDIVKYLSLYKQTIDKAKADSQYENDPELLVAKIFIQQKQIIEDDYVENLKELLKLDENEIILPNKADAKLRSQLEISEMYHHLFKDAVKQKIDKSTADKIREDAEKAGIIKGMFKYILDIDVLPNRDQTRYEEWFSQLGYTTNKDTAIKVKQMLSGYLIHEASSASNLIDSLHRGMKAAGKREAPSNEAEKDEKKT